MRREHPRRRAQGGLEFWGGSFLCDPFGQIIAEASHDREEILIGECDPKRMEDVRRNWPFLRDRRIDAYGAITQPAHRLTRMRRPTPLRQPGFRMPAEWEPHEATWIAWPHNHEGLAGEFEPFRGSMPRSFVISRAESRSTSSSTMPRRSEARAACSTTAARSSAAVHFHRWPTDRVWTRDSGPIFVPPRPPACRHELALQCLGEVSGLEARRPVARPRRQAPRRRGNHAHE